MISGHHKWHFHTKRDKLAKSRADVFQVSPEQFALTCSNFAHPYLFLIGFLVFVCLFWVFLFRLIQRTNWSVLKLPKKKRFDLTPLSFCCQLYYTCLTNEFPWSLHCANRTAGSAVELSTTEGGWPVADMLPVVSSGGEGWGVLVLAMLSCVGVDWVAVVPSSFDCDGWGWSGPSLAACVGMAWEVEELTLGEGSGGDTFSFHSGPYIFSSCLETLTKKTQIKFHLPKKNTPRSAIKLTHNPNKVFNDLNQQSSYRKAIIFSCHKEAIVWHKDCVTS